MSASREEDGSSSVTLKRGGEEGEKKAEDDLYGGSTDEGSDMETDVVGEWCVCRVSYRIFCCRGGTFSEQRN